MNPSAVVCREVFDENSQPSAEEVQEYAKEIGIDPASEGHLLPLAKDGLMHALPHPWKVCYDEKARGHYYYNTETKASQWDHPVDQVYKNLVVKARNASERGDSILDDTCASVQELVTFEETSKYGIEKLDIKDKAESQIEDISFDSSIGEEVSTGLRNISVPLTAITVKKSLNAVPKYNLTPLNRKQNTQYAPSSGFGEQKFGDIKNTLTKKIGDSSILAKPLQAFQLTNIRKIKTADAYSDEEFLSELSEAKPKISSRTISEKRIIDLSIKPIDQENAKDITTKKPPKLEKGLTLTGGGAIFLKSNKNVATEKAKSDLILFLENNKSKDSTKNTPVQSPSMEQPKSILRDRSYDPSGKVLSQEKLNIESFERDGAEDDKKIVRFNLEKTEDIHVEFSLSPSSNSSSDLAQERHNSIISNVQSDTNITDQEMKKVEPFFNPNNNPFFSDTLSKNPFKPGKLSPINRSGVDAFKSTTLLDEVKKSKQAKEVDWERVKMSTIADEAQNLNPDKDSFNVNNPETKSKISTPVKKLIKPHPNDYIRPTLFQKSFDRISDMIKPINIDSDSENDIPPSPRSPPYPQKNKISIKLMESIDSETSLDSPDRDVDDFEGNFVGMRLNQDQNTAEKDTDNINLNNLKHSKNELDKEMKKALEDYKHDLKIQNENERKRIKEEMDKELLEIKKSLENKHEMDKTELKDQLECMAADYKAKLEKAIEEARSNHDHNLEKAIDGLNDRLKEEYDISISKAKEDAERELNERTQDINKKFNEDAVKLQEEKNNLLNTLKSQLEIGNTKSITELRDQLSSSLEQDKVKLNSQNVDILDKMKQEHEDLCNEIRKDYRTEVDLLRSQHSYHLSQLREKLETERRRARDSSDEPSYERLKTDKKLLEDKYKCLKEKYARLKSDVKLSIERRNKRREQSLTTGSETERSNSNRNEKSGDILDVAKKEGLPQNDVKSSSIGNNNAVQSPIVKLRNGHDNFLQGSPKRTKIVIVNNNVGTPMDEASALSQSRQKVNANFLSAGATTDSFSDRSADNSRCKSPNLRTKSPLSNFLIREESKRRNSNDDSSIGANDTSHSQSDCNTKFNKNTKPSIAFKSDFEKRKSSLKGDGARSKSAIVRGHERAATDYHDSSDNANSSDHRKPKETVTGRVKRKSFTRHKSASTSRLNYSPKHEDRPCSPVENLRQQLRKLEDLEDQFPDLTLQVDTAAYHLRYPFADFDAGVGAAGGARAAELEFVAHRALVERERVRRARASLRRRKAALRERQGSERHQERDQISLQEEHDITDMEISLHRTRSLLGEKVIRLRHIEKILRRMNETSDDASPDNLGNHKLPDGKRNDDNKDATLSDISSHSSGFSSTEGHSDLNERRSLKHSMPNPNVAIFEQSSEIMTSLENLNTEIRDIWNVLNNQQQINNPKVLPPGQLLYTDLGWPMPLATINALPSAQSPIVQPATGVVPAVAVPIQSIPTLADRLHAYRQMVANPRTAAATVVSQIKRKHRTVESEFLVRTQPAFLQEVFMYIQFIAMPTFI